MLELNCPDDEFIDLMARWVFQSCGTEGKSGGSTSGDHAVSSHKKALMSVKPFDYPSYRHWTKFDRHWMKLPDFKNSEEELSRVFAAASLGHGSNFITKFKALRYWYMAGRNAAKVVFPGMQSYLLVANKTTIMYGRDCMPVYRALRAHLSLIYAEGLSRAALSTSSVYVQSYFDSFNQLTGCSVKCPADWSSFHHFDTGFQGTVPTTALGKLTVSCSCSECDNARKKVEPPYYSSKSSLDIHRKDGVTVLMSCEASNTKVLDLQCDRDSILKLEYRPKFFFRATDWMSVEGFGASRREARGYFNVPPKGIYMVPRMYVSGDAIYAAMYEIGFTSFTRSQFHQHQ